MFTQSNAQVDTFICDNGGFENGNTYYSGAWSTFTLGSNTCTPNLLNPFTPTTLPDYRRFAIVGIGADDVTGYPKVKYESKSLLINDRFSISDHCQYFDREVNKVTKKFRVTEENRNFTIWYSIVLQNPAEHDNRQPFFNIRCDLSPDELCFDGISIPAITIYPSGSCYREGEVVKATNWACHSIFISKDNIGQIATLEISVADCGAGAHFGYAYIDGICEPCSGSSYGSGTLDPVQELIVSCDGDSITLRGQYTEPTIDGNFTQFIDFDVPGFNIYGKTINESNKTFSFRMVKSDFTILNCRDVIAYLTFGNATSQLPPVPTNAVEICYGHFITPDLSFVVSECKDNKPNHELFSDDYYFVTVNIADAQYTSWILERWLDDPYPDESGLYTLTSGSGNANLKLGPFLIQEGSWTMIFRHNHCTDTVHIVPPDYCSLCPQMSKIKISNIQCNPINNSWSFDVFVPNNNPSPGEYYKINGLVYYFNVPNIINVGTVGADCHRLNLEYYNIPLNYYCSSVMFVCPPKPCFGNNYEDCNLEVYQKSKVCLNNGASYTVELDVKGAGSPCISIPMGGSNITQPFSNPIGPFSDDITIKIYSCGSSLPFSCNCPNTGCFKILKLYKPYDCEPNNLGEGTTRSSTYMNLHALAVIPNPVPEGHEFMIRSPYKFNHIEILNISGSQIFQGSFEGSEFKLKYSLAPGIYLIKSKNNLGEYLVTKFVIN